MPRRRTILRWRVSPQEPGNGGGRQEEAAYFVDLEPGELSGVFAAPPWLRDFGILSWLLVGISALLVAAVALLSLMNTIVIPVVTATIIAAVCAPLVRRLAKRMPRAAATVVVFLSLIVVGVGVFVLVLGGIVSQASTLQSTLQKAVGKAESALKDAGVSSSDAHKAASDASSTVSNAFHALIDGLGAGISALASLAVFLSFTALSLFFLLKDGPQIRAWTERHMGLPPAVGRVITGRTLRALQGYFAGVTAIAAFNAIVIGLGALIVGLPEVGAIMLVNFFAAYVPYLGAWSAGAFTVLIAVGSGGTNDAIVMAVIVLLANGALQQMIQPIAFGATLGIHPLAVLIVTIAGGSLFGTIGLVLAAPLTSAAIHISSDLARARAIEGRGSAEAPSPPTGSAPPIVIG